MAENRQQITIKRFDGGVPTDIRDQDRASSHASNLQHFEPFKRHLQPLRSTEADETKSLGLTKFVYAPFVNGYNLYGMGVDSAKNRFSYKDIADGGEANILTTAWSSGFTATQAGANQDLVAFHYKNFIYYFQGTTKLNRVINLTGAKGTQQHAAYQTITAFTTLAEPVHHPADDNAYFFADNLVYRLNDTTWDGLVLTLPSNLKITSGTAYGNYLAIACAPADSSANASAGSTVFLWDRDSSLSTISHKYNWGEGELKHLGVVDGILVGISNEHVNSIFGADGRKIVARRLIAGNAEVTHELEVDNASTPFYNNCNKLETGKELYWGMTITRDNTTMAGIWALDKNGAMYVAVVEEDDGGGGIQGFYKLGNYWYIAHSGDGSVNRTDDQSNYTYTSVWESMVFGNDGSTYQVEKVKVLTEAMPTAGQIVLKYRKDEETSFTTIKTFTADDSLRHIAKEIETTGKKLPEYKEIRFRVESTGGAVVNGLIVEQVEVDDD